MRVMVTGFPQMSHLYHLIPYAQALQIEGHEVVVACPPGAEDEIARAGLTAAKVGEPEPHSLQNWAKYGLLPSQETRAELAEALALGPAELDNWDAYYQFFLFAGRYYLPPEPRTDIDNLFAFARAWRPDLVLWESWFPCGGLLAKVAGAASGRVLIGPDYGAWAIERFAERRTEDPGLAENPLVGSVRSLAERTGVELTDEVLLGDFTVDPIPAPLRLSTGLRTTVPVRWTPYNGGAVLPEWLHERPEKPRVVLSAGVSNRAYHQGEDLVAKVFEAVEGLDVEVVATLNDNQLVGAPPVPSNVRVVDYVPLVQLLPTASAIIHRGGSGTFSVSLACGVPQLIADTGVDQRMVFSGEGEALSVTVTDRIIDAWLSSEYVADRGAGVRLDHLRQSAGEIREQILAVLADRSYADAAAALRTEWLSRPSPADIVPELEKLTALHG